MQPQNTKMNCQCTRAASEHKYKLSVHKGCLSARCTKINCQCTKVALKEAWLHVGRGLVTWFSRAFLLLNNTVGTSCSCHLPCKSIRHQEDILISHRKCMFCSCFGAQVPKKYSWRRLQFTRGERRPGESPANVLPVLNWPGQIYLRPSCQHTGSLPPRNPMKDDTIFNQNPRKIHERGNFCALTNLHFWPLRNPFVQWQILCLGWENAAHWSVVFVYRNIILCALK